MYVHWKASRKVEKQVGEGRIPDKGEGGGSSPPRPTINPRYLCGNSDFRDCRTLGRKAIRQLSERGDMRAIVAFHALVVLNY